MSRRTGLGVLIAAGLLAIPSGSAIAQTDADAAHEQDDAKPFVVPPLSDEELNEHLQSVESKVESGDAREIRGLLYGSKLVARALSSNRAVSDEQVETIVAAAEKLKTEHPEHAEQLDQYIFQIENLTIGREAPNIEGVDTDKVEFELNDYLGKVVVIDFWGDW